MPSGLKSKHYSDGVRFRDSVLATFLFLSLLWVIKSFEYALELDFASFGILPRTLEGSLGIVTGPLIHGDFFHLISNTFPIAILGIGVIYFYREIAVYIIGIIYFATGFAVWLIARDAYHIGASGIVYGLMFFLLISGFLKNDRRQLAISFVILLLYGGSMFSGLVPTDASISWEAHALGALTGLCVALLFRRINSTAVDESLDFSDDAPNSSRLTHTADSDFYYKIEYKDDDDIEG